MSILRQASATVSVPEAVAGVHRHSTLNPMAGIFFRFEWPLVRSLFPLLPWLAKVRDGQPRKSSVLTQSRFQPLALIPTDLVQDLYIRELKTYKPAPPVRLSVFTSYSMAGIEPVVHNAGQRRACRRSQDLCTSSEARSTRSNWRPRI